MNVEAFDDINGVGEVAEVRKEIHDCISDLSKYRFTIDIGQDRRWIITIKCAESQDESKREETHPRNLPFVHKQSYQVWTFRKC